MEPEKNGQNVAPMNQTELPSPDKHNKKVMAALAYFGILILIPYFVAREDSYVRFHIGQGLVLLSIEVVSYVLGSMFWQFMWLFQLVNLAVFVLAIVGIIRAVKLEEKPLPVVGEYSKYFKI